jgi:D-beta-D-heptose 7-phosphate kinase/D-beta-D-heptose 1-phosphate adenosyltransferase
MLAVRGVHLLTRKVVVVSGGFDPLHYGHVQYFEEARKLAGTKGIVIAILNNDNWLLKKKGHCFYPLDERYKILKAVKYIDEVLISVHKSNPDDMSIINELAMLQPTIFAKGGDRTADNIPELEYCKKRGIKVVFNVGGGKVQSSSEAVKRAREALRCV